MDVQKLTKPSLRKKLLFYSILLAIIPLGIAGQRMLTITQDELKSAANDELSNAAKGLAAEIDNFYYDTWLAPLTLIRNGMENENLGVLEKISLLTSTKDIIDIVSVQVTLENLPEPILIRQEKFSSKLESLGLNAIEVLRINKENIKSYFGTKSGGPSEPFYVPEADTWLIDLNLPLSKKINNNNVVLSARINAERLIGRVSDHSFNKTGSIILTDKNGMELFTPEKNDVSALELVKKASGFLSSGNRTIGVEPYTKPDGSKMLGAFSFPNAFDWAVISERKEDDAYLAVYKMLNSLLIWLSVGLFAAILVGIFSSGRISKPILEIGQVAQKVGKGNFNIRVSKLSSKDEIAELGKRINEMIEGLRERFELQKFVSGTTIDAIKSSDHDGIKLGGKRDTATVFFSDIRGFTAFSEKVEPEIVIDMLNTYLRHQANIVKKWNGDIDKYVGDELVAVFKGDGMVENALLCAIEIQVKMAELNRENPQWDIGIGIGINTGDMIMGAMGSEERMDYTILGDNVNLGARLCSAASKHTIIISENSKNYLKTAEQFDIEKLEPIKVKGKEKPINIYKVKGLVS